MTKKLYTSFIIRICPKQSHHKQLHANASEAVGQLPLATITLIDLETGARVGFASLTGLMEYLASFTEI